MFERDKDEYRDFDTALENWKKEYRRRYDAWRKNEPDAEQWVVFPETKFQNQQERLARSLELAEREGVSQGRPVTVSSCDQWSKPERITDGIDYDRAPVWCCADDDPNPTLEIDLQQTVDVQHITLVSCSWSPPLKGIAEVTVDGKTWTTVADTRSEILPDHEGVYELFFEPVKAAKVRMKFVPGSKPEVRELTVFSKAMGWQAPEKLGKKPAKSLALGRPVLSSRSESDHYGPWRTVDGIVKYADGYWAAAAPHPQWIVVDLGSVQPVSKTRVYYYCADGRGYAYKVIGSKDGITWKVLVDKSAEPIEATAAGDESTFAETPLKYIGVITTKNTANESAHLAEIQVF